MRSLVISEQSVRLHAEGETLFVQKNDQTLRRIPLGEIDQLLLFGQIEVSSAAIMSCTARKVDLVFLTAQGRFRARLVARASKHAALRLEQLRRVSDPHFTLALARRFVLGKVQHQRLLLLRAQRSKKDPALAAAIARLRIIAGRIADAHSLDILRGLEGQAAAIYFPQLGALIRPENLRFSRRSRRPPRDPANACLSFGYTVLQNIIDSELLRRGLEPMFGCLHDPAFGRPSLSLDLLEEFRPIIDALVVKLFNRGQLATSDFRYQHDYEPLDPNDPFDAQPPIDPACNDLPDPPSDNDPSNRSANPAVRPDPNDPPFDLDPPVTPGQPIVQPAQAVFLNELGRRVLLHALFQRLREPMHYPPAAAALELRQIITEQVNLLARVFEQSADLYEPFVPR